ncbi:hypothetical protein BZA77DRAFT_288867 [Pyronema omphalodes]|nr:hypothetical protein BZA77DRAFT_288867 [Pyronema omphalodes]
MYRRFRFSIQYAGIPDIPGTVDQEISCQATAFRICKPYTVDNDRLLNGSILSTPLNAPLPYVEEINYSVSLPTSEKRTIPRPDAEPFSLSILKAGPKPETNTQLDAWLAQIEKELIQLELRQ